MRRVGLVLGTLLILGGLALGGKAAWDLWGTDVAAEATQAALVEDLGWAVAIPTADPEKVEAGPVPVPEYEETFAVLRVPRWGEDYVRPITEGTEQKILDEKGIGHYEGTALPGSEGNFAIAGHRTTYGKPFADIDTLEEGDVLMVQTKEATFVYSVTGSQIVRPEDVHVLDSIPGRSLMTLTTCHPKYGNTERYIVYAELVS